MEVREAGKRFSMAPISGFEALQGWETVVMGLVGVHLLALAYWIFKVATEPSSSWSGFGRPHKREEDKE